MADLNAGNRPKEGPLSIFVQVLISILLMKEKDSNDTETMSRHPEVLICLVQLLTDSQEWITSGHEFPVLERSLLILAKEFPNAVFGVDVAQTASYYLPIRHKGYPKLASRFGMNNFLFERLFVTLRAFEDSPDILEYVLDCFGRLLPSASFLGHLVESPAELPFRGSRERRKLRQNLVSTMTRVIIRDHHEHDLLPQFLNAVWPDEFDLETLWITAVDLNGIFRSIEPKDVYGLVLDWFFPDRSQKIVDMFEACYDEGEVLMAVLNFWESFVSPGRSGERIEFPSDSSNGIVLFQQSANLVISFLTRFFDNYDAVEVSLEAFRKCCLILKSLVIGGYVLFDAFEIYEDPVFSDWLRRLIAVFNRCTDNDWEAIVQTPKAVSDVLSMFEAISRLQFRVLALADASACEVIFRFINLVMTRPGQGQHELCQSLLTNIGRFLLLHQESVLAQSVQEQYLGRMLNYLWQFIMNEERIEVRFDFARILLLDLSAFDAVKAKLIDKYEAMQPLITQMWEEFHAQLTNVIKERKCDGLMEPVNTLRSFCTRFSISLSFA
jgi:hypothetical protein